MGMYLAQPQQKPLCDAKLTWSGWEVGKVGLELGLKKKEGVHEASPDAFGMLWAWERKQLHHWGLW